MHAQLEAQASEDMTTWYSGDEEVVVSLLLH